mmetsp:Transcript_10850/g.24268  ORF Transcript_10850/g.24268 Transcript_10850/m.24268 type:complete len:595 (+) Transcript_10850:38-1822(+)
MASSGAGTPKPYPPGFQLEGIVTPHEHDVLSGRGNFVNYHTGNEHFRALVKKHKIAYVACPKPEKGRFALLIVDEIRSLNPPGRFLRQDASTKLWSDVGDKKSVDKTRQALREGAPELLKELTAGEEDGVKMLPLQPSPLNATHPAGIGGGTVIGQQQHTPDQQQYFMQQMAQVQAEQQRRQQEQQQQAAQMGMGMGMGMGLGLDPPSVMSSPNNYHQFEPQSVSSGGLDTSSSNRQVQHMPFTTDQLRTYASVQQSGHQVDTSSFVQQSRSTATSSSAGDAPSSSPSSSNRPGAETSLSQPHPQQQTSDPSGQTHMGAQMSPTGMDDPRMLQQQELLRQQQLRLAQQQVLLRQLQEQQRRLAQQGAQAQSSSSGNAGAEEGGTVSMSTNKDPSTDPSSLQRRPHQQLPEAVTSQSQQQPKQQQGTDQPQPAKRRGSLTFDDLVKGIKGAKAAQKLGMSSTNMSLSVGDIDSNLSSAFEDSLIISVEGSLENSSASGGRADKKPKAGEAAARAADRSTNNKDPNAPAPVQTVAVGGNTDNNASIPSIGFGDSSILRGLTTSEAAMSFSLSDAADLLNNSAMQMSYRLDKQDESK